MHFSQLSPPCFIFGGSSVTWIVDEFWLCGVLVGECGALPVVCTETTVLCQSGNPELQVTSEVLHCLDYCCCLHCLHCCCCLRAVASCRSCTNDPALSRNQTRIPPIARLPPPRPKRSLLPLSEAATSIPVREWFVRLDRLRRGSAGEREAKDGGISLTEAVRAMARPAGIPRLPVRC